MARDDAKYEVQRTHTLTLLKYAAQAAAALATLSEYNGQDADYEDALRDTYETNRDKLAVGLTLIGVPDDALHATLVNLLNEEEEEGDEA